MAIDRDGLTIDNLAALIDAGSGVTAHDIGGAMHTGTALPAAVVGSSLTSLGTIATGIWRGTVVEPGYGGTGVANNAASTLTISGAFSLGVTLTAATAVTFPTSGTLAVVGGAVTAHELLSASHSDTTVGTVVRGDIITGQGATPKWVRLAFPGTPTGKVLVASATDVAWSAAALGSAAWAATGDFAAASHNHAWGDITSGVPTTIGGYGITDFNSLGDARWSLTGHAHAGVYEPVLGNPAASGYVLSSTDAGVRSWVAALSNPMNAVGDMIYGGAAGAPTKLVAVAVGSYLASAGTTTAPAWAALNQAAVAGLTTGSTVLFAGLTLGTTPGTGTGALYCGALTATTGAFSDTIASTKAGPILSRTGATGSPCYQRITTTGGDLIIGVETSGGGDLLAGSTGYAAILTSVANKPVQIGANNALVATFAVGGALTLAAGLTATTIAASGLISANLGLTVASGQTLTLTGATVTGFSVGAANVAAGTFPSGAYVFQGALSGITTLAMTGALSGVTTITASGLILTAASDVNSGAGLRLPHGVAPGIPLANGDIWTTTAGLFVRINGTTKTVTLT